MIAMNRIWAIYAPHHYRAHHTKRLAYALCALAWFLGITLISPMIVLDDIYRTRKSETCRLDDAAHPLYSIVARIFLNVPVFLIPIIYIILVIQLTARKKRQLKVRPNASGPNRVSQLPTLSAGNALPSISRGVQGTTPSSGSASRRHHSLKSLVVLAWIAFHTAIFWAPITFYHLLMLGSPKLISFSPSVYAWLATWNLSGYGFAPFIFLFTVLNSNTTRRATDGKLVRFATSGRA
ncbi:hypothetical protein RvY_14959 [Ramazzottius varieornatus]|uniref:G-protein coupled receptors family 1 profile domain-containing protein n=1 Tax=Ramazzottius varieornatus TaxID=947166 RepID=A0A1D1VT45_RAMVA|nr:hypothetical protein RvY_14959 [Ramazzottius varieornatus]